MISLLLLYIAGVLATLYICRRDPARTGWYGFTAVLWPLVLVFLIVLGLILCVIYWFAFRGGYSNAAGGGGRYYKKAVP